jgi:hypothetical protein
MTAYATRPSFRARVTTMQERSRIGWVIRALIAATLLTICLSFSGVRDAAADGAYVVQTCGTTLAPYKAGATRQPTVDVNGNSCVTSTGASGITLGPSQNGIGNVGGKTVDICVTPAVTASNAYGINYVVGGLLTFSNAFTSTGSGILQGVTVTVDKVQSQGFTFFPFNANPSNTTWTEAAVANINAADVPAQRTPVSLSGNNQLGTATVAGTAGIGEALAPGTSTLYGILVTNGALTNNFSTTSDVQVCVEILQDL